ncbi:MAG TPA: CoA-binding protein [Candidatus Hydrogenedentes bacterium]|nr:CoA-binding protein [Candidatus Hydrogenedentota bacterium]HIJ73897.1 CoA-binding protein [Candidatus Hydrogenedentota bacterium]
MAKTIAIIGASNDRRKYGNKAVRAFAEGGWKVCPVNANEDEIEGLQCYRSIADVPGPIDRVAMYVPPGVGKRLLPDIAARAPTEVFFNPGSEDENLLRTAKILGLNTVQACSIVDIGRRPDMYPDE